MQDVHHGAADGFTAGAATYAQGRPDYPLDVDHWLRNDLALGPGKTVLDLGAGTGKFIPRLRTTGAAVIAVDPVRAMLDQLTGLNPDIEAKEGSANAIPLADNAVDAVVCAQAFHWFANRDALAEIRRVLKPSGALGLIWNVRDERVGWVAALSDLMGPFEGDTPRYHTGEWRRLFPADGFSPLLERHFPHGHTGAAERVIVDRILSVSFIAALPPADQAALVTKIRTLIATSPDLAGQDIVTFPYVTAAFHCRKTG
ncbi:MAG TPA: class I SAM-dependent methyltransferase [Telmatospirillum sp.]|nr:class I SAM-dependent methyltransferase [Telmatospirillum sp.]